MEKPEIKNIKSLDELNEGDIVSLNGEPVIFVNDVGPKPCVSYFFYAKAGPSTFDEGIGSISSPKKYQVEQSRTRIQEGEIICETAEFTRHRTDETYDKLLEQVV